MGMYTELVLAVDLMPAVPREVVNILKHLATETEDSFNLIDSRPNHEFFQCPRWEIVLNCDSSMFPGDAYSKIRFSSISGWALTSRSSLKNYDGEIEKFLSWIAPYVAPSKVRDDGLFFVGYKQYEEDENPTLIYINAKSAKVHYVAEWESRP